MKSDKLEDKSEFWKSFLKAIETEPVERHNITGASGLSHPVVAIGIDKLRERIVIISGEYDARSALMAHADIQAALPSKKVVMARQAPINLGHVAKAISEILGKAFLNFEDVEKIVMETKTKAKEEQVKFYTTVLSPILKAFGIASFNTLSYWKELIHQLSLLDITINIDEEIRKTKPLFDSNVNLNNLIIYDPVEVDRRLGVCSIPLYALSDEESEVFHKGKDIEHVQFILKTQGIFQYFFPAADHLILGLIEKESIPPSVFIRQLPEVQKLGHPFGVHELLNSDVKISELIPTLKEAGFLVEGEFGIELSSSGKAERGVVRFKPREGLLSKISKIFSCKIDITLEDIKKLFNQ